MIVTRDVKATVKISEGVEKVKKKQVDIWGLIDFEVLTTELLIIG